MSTEFLTQTAADYKAMIEADFSESIILISTPVQGIFDETYVEVDPETGAAIMSRFPRVSFSSEVLPVGFVQGSSVVARGKTYKAKTIEKDGQGLVMVKLHV